MSGLDVVIVAAEAVPLAKTGGLADVAGALPIALARLGVAATLIVPAYRQAWRGPTRLEDTGLRLGVPIGPKTVEGRVLTAALPDSDARAFLIDQPAYFDRDGLYQERGLDYPDNAERFIFFDRAVLEAIRLLGLRPDVLHVNDWHTGLIPVDLEEFYRTRPGFANVGTLLTIHNLAYQGLFPPSVMHLTGLDPRLFNWGQLEFHGQLGFLKAGLVFADMLNTVSPTYAREIQTAEFGRGLDGILRARGDDLRGIINGTDGTIWHPAGDRQLLARYDAETVEAGKFACKLQLQRLAGLPERPEVPVLAQIGRLDKQKGWDLVAALADDLLRRDVQLVVLGEGQPRYHELLDQLARRHPGKVRVFLEFSGSLAHRIEAGADILLMPSLYEPCGLNQLYSQAYGTVPIVRATGGLADTVTDADPSALADGSATGFVFHEPTPAAFRGAIDRALALWDDRDAWVRLILAGMSRDWSWERSARTYVQLYEEIGRRRRARVAV